MIFVAHGPLGPPDMDWCAWVDGQEEKFCCYRRTKEDAIQSLIEWYADMFEEDISGMPVEERK
jgi:hypothetical protein